MPFWKPGFQIHFPIFSIINAIGNFLGTLRLTVGILDACSALNQFFIKLRSIDLSRVIMLEMINRSKRQQHMKWLIVLKREGQALDLVASNEDKSNNLFGLLV